MMRSILRRGGIRAGLLLGLGLVCAFATPGNAQPAHFSCMGFPHYPRGMTDPKDGSIAYTRDSADKVVAWFRQHLDNSGPGGAWLFGRKNNREFTTWVFAMDVNHISIDSRAGAPTVRIRYHCP